MGESEGTSNHELSVKAGAFVGGSNGTASKWSMALRSAWPRPRGALNRES